MVSTLMRICWLLATAASLIGVAHPTAVSAASSVGQVTAPSPAVSSAINWIRFAKGAEYTRLTLKPKGWDKQSGTALIARLDPAAVLFRIYYHEQKRKTVQAWAIEWPGAILLVNANFFRGNGNPIGLVKIGGKVLNPPTGRPESGQFQVRGEVPSIFPLQSSQPDAKGIEPYTESFEGYPLLILDGKPTTFSATMDLPNVRERRTVIAQDEQGRIVIVVTVETQVTLMEITDWLQDSGLGLKTALNIDGGSSSQMRIGTYDHPLETILGFAAVPVVLAIYPR